MRSKLSFVLPVLALLAIGTAETSKSKYIYGVIQASCAPWDGPAIAITLSTNPLDSKHPASPYLNLGVWRGLPIHAGQVVKFSSTSDAGFASRCSKEGNCERAESGELTFDTFKEGAAASGRYELHFKGGETVSGSFNVKWYDERVLCG